MRYSLKTWTSFVAGFKAVRILIAAKVIEGEGIGEESKVIEIQSILSIFSEYSCWQWDKWESTISSNKKIF